MALTINNSKEEIKNLYSQPLLELLAEAQKVQHNNGGYDLELCQLISVKTGGCPEDCSYCSQSNHHESKITVNPLMDTSEVEAISEKAKKNGVKRICLGAAYRSPNPRAMRQLVEYIKVIKKHGFESCVTAGMLDQDQANELKSAGLDYYNHNIDTSPEYYAKVVRSRTFKDRVDTISHVGNAGIKICCGGILGMGETREDRISFIHALTSLPYSPASIPINTLVKIPGTPMANIAELDKFELLRTIACIRVLFPQSRIRLSAGRKELSELEQTLCFMAGANSIFYGEQLLTTENNLPSNDQQLLAKLGAIRE